MKILFLSSYYPPKTRGGAEISTKLIADGLVELGHEVDVVTEGKPVEFGFTQKPLLEKAWAKKVAKKLKAKVDLGKYDVVHAQDFRTALVLAELGLGEKAAVTIRDYWPLSGTTNYLKSDGSVGSDSKWSEVLFNPRVKEVGVFRGIARACQYAFNLPYRKWAWGQLSNKIYISNGQRELIERVLDSPSPSAADGGHSPSGRGRKTAVVYNSIAEGYLNSPVGDGQSGEVLYVGRVEFYKGVGLLLEAWREIVKKVPGVHLTIVGEGAQKEEYQKLVQKWGLDLQVSFKGRVEYDRLQEYYDKSAVVMAPHLWREPFGRTVVEAMARGKIVVAANHGGSAEVIHDNVTGLLFEKNSKDALVEALKSALKMPEMNKREMQRLARMWVRENLGAEKIAREYEKFYQVLDQMK